MVDFFVAYASVGLDFFVAYAGAGLDFFVACASAVLDFFVAYASVGLDVFVSIRRSLVICHLQQSVGLFGTGRLSPTSGAKNTCLNFFVGLSQDFFVAYTSRT